MSKERRYLSNELRAKRNATGGGTIAGYAAKFNVVSEDLGGFREVLLPGCFDLEANADVLCNREHNDCDPLGRTTSGTLRISADDTGLAFECDVADTTLGRDTLTLVERRDVESCSFAFEAIDEEWGVAADDLPLRKIKRCALYDVAIVTHPAYPETEVALRSLSKSRAVRSVSNVVAARLALAERILILRLA